MSHDGGGGHIGGHHGGSFGGHHHHNGTDGGFVPVSYERRGGSSGTQNLARGALFGLACLIVLVVALILM